MIMLRMTIGDDDGEMTNVIFLRAVAFEFVPSMAKGRSICDGCTQVVQLFISNTVQGGIITLTSQLVQSVPPILSVACALLTLKKAFLDDGIRTANEPPLQAAFALQRVQTLVGYTHG